MFDPVQSLHVTTVLFYSRYWSNGPERLLARIFGAHPGSYILFNLPFQVVLQLFIEFLLDFVASQERSEKKAKLVGQAHVSGQTARTMSEMAPDSRSHCAVSRSRTFLPALDNE